MKVEGKYKEIKKKRWEVPIDIIFSKIDIKKNEKGEKRTTVVQKKQEIRKTKRQNELFKRYLKKIYKFKSRIITSRWRDKLIYLKEEEAPKFFVVLLFSLRNYYFIINSTYFLMVKKKHRKLREDAEASNDIIT